ncbi:MAG TPA: hypothetical protein VLE74_04165 [Candidatus Saccharimonadales bacterium]|nr:hypothetical protein [Candidatus Saccharimonadales bacterium]
MAKSKIKTRKKPRQELDGVYVLKIVLYLIIGSQWLWLTDTGLTRQIPLPIGVLVGGAFALHDHFQIDRKIEFAILLIACLVGFWSHTGLQAAIL